MKVLEFRLQSDQNRPPTRTKPAAFDPAQDGTIYYSNVCALKLAPYAGKTSKIMGTESIHIEKSSRPFWQKYLIIIAVDSLIVFLISAIFLLAGGNNQISNLYFLSTAVLLVIAVIPVFTEMGGNLKLAGKVLKEEEAEKLVKAQAERSRIGMRKTYLYGLAGITTFVLALLFI